MRSQFALFTFFVLMLGKSYAADVDSIDKKQRLLDAVDKLSFNKLERSYAKAEERLTASLIKYLNKFQKSEEKLIKKLKVKDSIAALQNAKGLQEQYDQLANRIKNPEQTLKSKLTGNYVPKLDSLKTLLGYSANSLQGINLPKLPQINEVSKQISQLQAQLHTAADIKQFIAQRQAEWKEQLAKLGLTKELAALKKQTYYYQQQIREYKELLNNPDKLTERALSLAATLPSFQNFMAQNSQLAQLFRVPGASNTNAGVPIPGLQTQAQVQQQIQQQLGSNTNPTQYLQQQIGEAQSALDKLKDKVNALGGGSDELEMPEGFKPNNQKTKRFWQRIELGMNIQSQRSNRLLPVTSDLALSMGYKLSDKSIVGIGASYKMGWGTGINNIRITHEGIGLRSFVDIKLKGSIWITGGYEQNYMQGFEKIPALDDYSKWQQSGLIGISKKYKIAKKGGNLQLLYDMLHYKQVPRTNPILFRVGYTF